MIPQEFTYSKPNSLLEAINLIAQNKDDVKLLAGGMSLIPMMKLRLATPEHLIDLGGVAELNSITENLGKLHVGALTTHDTLVNSFLIQEKCPLLAETASHIGDTQVRNMGTIGGSTAHADPAADYPAALCALDAQIKLVKKESQRIVPTSEFFVDALTTVLEPDEIITEIIVPVEDPKTGTSYKKLRQPASGFAIVGIATRLQISDGKVSLARIGVTGLGPNGFRATEVENALQVTAATDADINKAITFLDGGVEVNSDIHASSNYRSHVARIYTTRSIKTALARVPC